MVGTIIPIVHGERADGRRRRPIGIHLGGTLAGAAVVGLSLGTAGRVTMLGMGRLLEVPLMLPTLAAGHLLLALRESGCFTWSLPESHWQVPRHWQLTMGRPLALFVFGLVLGCGVFTAIPSGAFYALLLWPLLLASPIGGVAIFSAYGVGRVLPIIVLVRAMHTPAQVPACMDVVDHSGAVMRLANAAILAACAGWVAGMWIGGYAGGRS
jgi:hypothetical protein